MGHRRPDWAAIPATESAFQAPLLSRENDVRKDSFDPETLAFLGKVMCEIEAQYHTIDDSLRETIAARIMSMAGDGETDYEKIRAHALEVLDKYAPRQKTG
jgi:hypothetical protein